MPKTNLGLRNLNEPQFMHNPELSASQRLSKKRKQLCLETEESVNFQESDIKQKEPVLGDMIIET